MQRAWSLFFPRQDSTNTRRHVAFTSSIAPFRSSVPQHTATYRNVPLATLSKSEYIMQISTLHLEINSNNCPKQQGISHCGVKLRLKHVETRHSVYKSSKSVHSCRFGAISRKKVLLIANKQNTCSPRPPALSQHGSACVVTTAT